MKVRHSLSETVEIIHLMLDHLKLHNSIQLKATPMCLKPWTPENICRLNNIAAAGFSSRRKRGMLNNPPQRGCCSFPGWSEITELDRRSTGLHTHLSHSSITLPYRFHGPDCSTFNNLAAKNIMQQHQECHTPVRPFQFYNRMHYVTMQNMIIVDYNKSTIY